MLITVWVFVGIEGAVVVSSRARQRKDIGRATILGLLTALSIYVLVTLLSMGVIQVNQLAQYPNPSMAQVLTTIIGPWGKYIIAVGLFDLGLRCVFELDGIGFRSAFPCRQR